MNSRKPKPKLKAESQLELKSESEFLKNYDPTQYARPNASVDVVIFTVIEEKLHVLTVKRREHPFMGSWSLVGGYVDPNQDESLKDTAKRKLVEKTGVKTPYLEQVVTVGNRTRDPRGWSISTVYFALISYVESQNRENLDSGNVQWVEIKDDKIQQPLAFDHAELLKICIKRLRNKVLYTNLPGFLLPKHFSIGELQSVYEIILSKPVEQKAFRRRVLNADILEEIKDKTTGKTRPAKVYRLRESGPHFFTRSMGGDI